MWRWAFYVLSGVVTVSLVLMAVMFVQARDADRCDTSERGLGIWDEDDERWVQVELPRESTDLPPCKGRNVTEFKVSKD